MLVKWSAGSTYAQKIKLKINFDRNLRILKVSKLVWIHDKGISKTTNQLLKNKTEFRIQTKPNCLQKGFWWIASWLDGNI